MSNISLHQLDEQGVKFPMNILSAFSDSKELQVRNNVIVFEDILQNEYAKIDFQVQENQYFSAEVIIREINQ